MAVRNNSASVINNLRRLGARRNETKEETRRIEERLGALFRENAGSRCLLGTKVSPPVAEDANAGEVDLICAPRRSCAYLGAQVNLPAPFCEGGVGTSHFRFEGRAAEKKVPAVQRALELDVEMTALGLVNSQPRSLDR